MSTSYTSLLGLALPVTGELSGTWGSMVDNAITSPIDIAVAGTQSITGDSNVTLSVTNGDTVGTNLAQVGSGSTGSAQYAIILCSGARTALRTITAPAASKIYTIINATTGGFAVKIVGSGPTTGLTIPNGSSAVIAWNGSDFIEVGSSTVGNFTVNGNLTVTGTSTLTGAVTNTAGTANGVAYLNGSKVLTTGTALTFDGTTFKNTGGGAAFSGVVGAGISASVNGRLRAFNSTNDRFVEIFNDATTSIINSTFGSAGASPLVFQISDSEQMRLTSTGLGIGTSSPSEKLHIYGASPYFLLQGSEASAQTLYIRENAGGLYFGQYGIATRMLLDSAGNLGLGVTPSASTLPTIQSNYGVLSGNTNINIVRNAYYNSGWKYVASAAATQYQQDTGSHYWYNAPSGTAGNAITFTQAMTLDASGNLGIGTTSPATKLQVNSAAPAIRIQETTSGGDKRLELGVTAAGQAYIGANQSAQTLDFQTVGTTRMTLDASGNLLLGNTITKGKAYINSSSAATGVGANPTLWVGGGTGVVGQVSEIGFTYGISSGVNPGTYAPATIGWIETAQTGYTYGDLIFSTRNVTTDTQPSERARIDSSGNLLVGATATVNAAKAYFAFTSSNNGVYVADTTGVSGAQFMRFDTASSVTCGSIVRVAATSALTYNTTSDYRLKNVVGAVLGSGDRIDALEPIEYEWKATGTRTRGFLAHKFQEIYAGSVTGTKDEIDAEGTPIYQGMQASSAEVIADLVAEIQSLRKRLAAAGI